MNHVRMYLMIAAVEDQAELGAALANMAAALSSAPGLQSTTLLQSRDDPRRYRFVETWDDEASRKGAGRLLPKAVMERVFAALEGRPDHEDLIGL